MTSIAELRPVAEPMFVVGHGPNDTSIFGAQILDGLVTMQPDVLAPRDAMITLLTAIGASNPEIGQRVGLSGATVKGRLHGIMTDLGVESRTRHGILHVCITAPQPTMRIGRRISPELVVFSPAEIKIVDLIMRGLSTKQVAARLQLSPFTVKQHIGNMPLRASNLHGKEQLSAGAIMRRIPGKTLPEAGLRAIPSIYDLAQ